MKLANSGRVEGVTQVVTCKDTFESRQRQFLRSIGRRVSRYFKWDALRGLVPFVQFKKRENIHGPMLLSVQMRKLSLCRNQLKQSNLYHIKLIKAKATKGKYVI